MRSHIAAALRLLPGSSENYGPIRHARSHAGHEGVVTQLSPGRAAHDRTFAGGDVVFASRIAPFQSGARIRPRTVERIPDGRFIGIGWGCVIEAGDVLRVDLSPSPGVCDGEVDGHCGWTRCRLPPVRRLNGSVAVVTAPQAENFHHWLLDTLPRIGMMREAGLDPTESSAVIVPGSIQSWHEQALLKLGIAPNTWLPATQALHIRADEIIAPSWSEPGRDPEHYDYTPEGLAFVRRLFGNRGESVVSSRRLLVSRARTASRRLPQPCEDVLERQGFLKVYLEDFTLDQQASMFRTANAIVMPTGGNLANLVHCEPGTVVIELFSPSYIPLFTPAFASSVGLRYVPMVGRGRLDHSDSGGAQDVVFDPDELGERVAAALP